MSLKMKVKQRTRTLSSQLEITLSADMPRVGLSVSAIIAISLMHSQGYGVYISGGVSEDSW